MKKSILVLASVLAVLAQAPAFAVVRDGHPDVMYLTLSCYTPALNDAGMRVTISYGGIKPHYSAEVSETSLAGKNVILTVSDVTSTEQGISKIYTDSESEGKNFRLVYRPAISTEDSPEPLNATLILPTDSGETSVSLTCHQINHPM